jgi:hypothetical protein
VVPAGELDAALRAATRVSFDRLDSDGCMSTNDTVIVLAASNIRPDGYHPEITAPEQDDPRLPTEEEWEFVAPYLALVREDAPQREHDLREVFNALRWIVRAGAPRRRRTRSRCRRRTSRRCRNVGTPS